jgi:hypothetical protein
MSLNDDHIPAPAEHTPDLEMFAHEDLVEITLKEKDTKGAWISMLKEDCVEIQQ